MSERWLSFDRGEWEWLGLNDQEYETAEAFTAHMTPFRCGHWIVNLSDMRPKVLLNGRFWEHLVNIELPGGGAVDDLVFWESVLVRDFPSLLQLFTLLRAGDIEYAPELDVRATASADEKE